MQIPKIISWRIVKEEKSKKKLRIKNPIHKIEVPMKVFRIIPHAKARNHTLHRFYSQLFELFNVKEKKYTWSIKKPLYVAYREAPAFWYVMKMYNDGKEKKVEFLLAIPATFEKAFKTKWKNHEGRRQSTLEEVTDIHFPKETDTDLYRLRLKRHDMFSLKYDHSSETSPIRELLNVSDELEAEESVDIFIKCESMDRKKWRKITDYAWSEWRKGSMVYRTGFDPGRMARETFGLVATVGFGLKSVGEEVLQGIQNTFFKAEPIQKKEKQKLPNKDREELLISGKLTPQSEKKWTQPAFKVTGRVAIHADDEVKRGSLARSTVVALEALNGDNQLQLVKVNINGKKELNDLKNWQSKDIEPNLMSVDEVASIEQLPTKEVQEEYQDVLTTNQRIEIEVPKVFLDDAGILCGTATDRGTTHNIYIPTSSKDFLYTPRVFNGSPRMGKDMAIVNLIVEAKRKHGIGAVIPDFIDERNRTADGKHWRGMSNSVRDALNPEDVMDFDMSNTLYSLYLGLQSAFQNLSDPRILGDVIAEYLSDFLLAEGDGDKFQTTEYVREAAKIAAGDLIGMKQMFIDQKYRQAKIKQYEDVFDTFLWEDYDKMTDKNGQMSTAQATKAAAILRRIGQIEGREYLKPMFCQTLNPKFELAKWIEEGKVIILRVRMPQGYAMPEPVKQILGYWIMLITFIIKLSLDGSGAGTFMVFNEPHQYISKGLIHFMERMLSEGPKYRFTPVIAFHNFSQFSKHRSFVDMLKSSNPNWHLFKNSNQDVYKELMPILSKTFETEQQAFEATKEFQYIACFMNGGEYEAPFVCDALPMVNDRYQEQDNSKLTEEHIKLYGRPTQEVLQEIKERRRGGK